MIVATVTALLLMNGCGTPEKEPLVARPDAPNVLVYVVCSLRRDALKPYSTSAPETPGAGRLAREGTLFENAYAQSSWTRPSIGSILTALYPRVHGAEGREDTLLPAVIELPEHFRRNGYEAAAFVTNPNIGSFFGFGRSFDEYHELYHREDPGHVDSRELVTSSNHVTAKAAAWLDQAERPFFLFLQTADPHYPYHPPERPVGKSGASAASADQAHRALASGTEPESSEKERLRSLYLAEVVSNDASFAQLLKILDESGLSDETIVVFLGDHGEEFWEHGGHGHGETLYDEVLRVPLIIRYPAAVASGQRVDRPVELVSVLPTVARLAGLEFPGETDGVDLFAPESDQISVHSHLQLGDKHLGSIRDESWSLIWDIANDRELLFEVSTDPAQKEDVLSNHPLVGIDLFGQLAQRLIHNIERYLQLSHPGSDRHVSESELPRDARETLKTLGYL